MTTPRIVVFSKVKNEAPYLLEWLAFNRTIGVTDFVIFSNDCTDGTDQMLDRCQEMGLLHHVRNPYKPDEAPQKVAMRLGSQMDIVNDADWVLHIDPDEFTVIQAGDGTLPALIEACDSPDAIAMNLRLYGSSDQQRFEDTPVTERFRMGSNILPPETPAATEIKTLYKPASFRGIGLHAPVRPRQRIVNKRGIRWLNGSGGDLSSQMVSTTNSLNKRGRIRPGMVGFDLVHVNHYVVRSREEFLMRMDRGAGVNRDRQRDRYTGTYYNKRNVNTAEQPAVKPFLHQDIAQELLQDPELRRLHDEAVAIWKSRIAELLESPENQLFAETGAFPDVPDPA